MTIKPDPKVCRGAPCVQGTRLTVYNVVLKRWMESGQGIVEDDYKLAGSEIEDARQYCASLACMVDERRVRFCGNCVLDELDNFERLDVLRDCILRTGAEALRGRVPDHSLHDPFSRGWEIASEQPGAGSLKP